MKGDRDWRPDKVKRNTGKEVDRKRAQAIVDAESERCHIRDHDGEDEYRTRYDPKQFADRADRQAHPWLNYRSAYAHRLGPEPIVAAGDREFAERRCREIQAILDEGMATDNLDGIALWTRPERERLKRMLTKWRDRASGQNAYFNIAGNRPRATEWEWHNIRRERVRIDLIRQVKSAGREI